jgi:SAM-dependent methyltransferase
MKCNLCNFEGEFIPSGESEIRKYATCPQCLSAERHRLYKLYLERISDKWFGKNILEIAPFALADYFQSNTCRYLSIDIAKGKAILQGDAMETFFKDECFDMIMIAHAFGNWIIHYKTALEEIYRLLHPSGFAIIQVPQIPPDILSFKDFKPVAVTEPLKVYSEGNKGRYNPSFKACLEEVGFKVNIIKFFNTLDAETIFKYNPANEDIYEVTK